MTKTDLLRLSKIDILYWLGCFYPSLLWVVSVVFVLFYVVWIKGPCCKQAVQTTKSYHIFPWMHLQERKTKGLNKWICRNYKKNQGEATYRKKRHREADWMFSRCSSLLLLLSLRVQLLMNSMNPMDTMLCPRIGCPHCRIVYPGYLSDKESYG